jgi:hypothetical protein
MQIMATITNNDVTAQIIKNSEFHYELRWTEGIGWNKEIHSNLPAAILRLSVLMQCEHVGGGMFTKDTKEFQLAADQFLINNIE